MAKKSKENSPLRSAFIYFCIATGLVLMNLVNVMTLFWVPPKLDALIEVEGRFESHRWGNCGEMLCAQKPYILHTRTGQRLEIYCEPEPALNQCLDGNAEGKQIRDLSDSVSRIQYYDEYAGLDRFKQFNVMSAIYNGRSILSYDDSVSRIKYGSYAPGDYWYEHSTPRRPGGKIIRYISIFCLALLSLSFVNLLVNLWRKAVKR